MASGKKNYFRHSNQARKDDKIMDLIISHGKESYFHFFCILEMCAEAASDRFPDDGVFVFHRRTMCAEMMVSNSKLGHHLAAIQSALLFQYVLTENKVELSIPNLAKYMGKYESKIAPNHPNKRKENKIKEKKIKSNTPAVPAVDVSGDAVAVLEMFNRVCKKDLKPTKSNLKEINARLNEKYVLNEFEAVTVHMHAKWGENADMRQYVRPQTLFSGKFGAYLSDARDPGCKTREDKLRDFFESAGVEGVQK